MIALLILVVFIQIVTILLIFMHASFVRLKIDGQTKFFIDRQLVTLPKSSKVTIVAAPPSVAPGEYRRFTQALGDYETALIFTPRGRSVHVVMCISDNLNRMDEMERMHCDAYQVAEEVGTLLVTKPKGE